MRKKKEIDYIYPIYLEKYNNYELNEHRMKHIEDKCRKMYKEEMGINLDGFIRINIYYEILAQLVNNIENLDVLNKYKAIVLGHSNNIVKYLSGEEIDIIFEDTIDYVKENYDRSEAVGSYIVRNFKNALISYVNENYNQNIDLISEDNCKLKMLK